MAEGTGIKLDELINKTKNFQESMQENKKRLREITVTSKVGGGIVTATVDGERTLRSVKIAPELIVDGDVAAIEDLVVSAVNSANEELVKKLSTDVEGVMHNMFGNNLENAKDFMEKILGGILKK